MNSERLSLQAERERRQARVRNAVGEMVRLFIPGHEAEQTPEYEAWRAIYLQSQIDSAYPDLPEGTHSRFTIG